MHARRAYSIAGVILLCAGSAALGFAWANRGPAAPPPRAPGSAMGDAAPAPGIAPVSTDPGAERALAGKPAMLRLPDGSEVPPLNGVKEPAALVWGDEPYSPIVGKELGSGIEWYVHADGTRTTTLDRWRPDLGRMDSVTLVAHPKALAPVDPETSREK